MVRERRERDGEITEWAVTHNNTLSARTVKCWIQVHRPTSLSIPFTHSLSLSLTLSLSLSASLSHTHNLSPSLSLSLSPSLSQSFSRRLPTHPDGAIPGDGSCIPVGIPILPPILPPSPPPILPPRLPMLIPMPPILPMLPPKLPPKLPPIPPIAAPSAGLVACKLAMYLRRLRASSASAVRKAVSTTTSFCLISSWRNTFSCSVKRPRRHSADAWCVCVGGLGERGKGGNGGNGETRRRKEDGESAEKRRSGEKQREAERSGEKRGEAGKTRSLETRTEHEVVVFQGSGQRAADDIRIQRRRSST